MFERYGEQARDRKLSLLCAFIFLGLSVVAIVYGAWGAGSMLAILTLIFGIPPFLFSQERFEKTFKLLDSISFLGWL